MSSTPLEKASGRTKTPSTPRPSASILLLSSTNQVLLLHRVATSTAFASAHVFPGGNLSAFHEGPGPYADSSASYRLAAIRETFEETGILLTQPLTTTSTSSSSSSSSSQTIPPTARVDIHTDQVRFPDLLSRLNLTLDISNLIPFTRWITPPGQSRRFTTQMYLYMMPLSAPATSPASHDGGLEHTACEWASPSAWLSRAQANDVSLFPPQMVLLKVLSEVMGGREGVHDFAAQRERLRRFVAARPTEMVEGQPGRRGRAHGTEGIPWGEKVVSPYVICGMGDGRVVLGLEKAGEEEEEGEEKEEEKKEQVAGRGGDWDRVVLVRFERGGPRDMEVRWREEILGEGREGGKL